MKDSFPWGRTFVLGFGFFGISIVWPIFNSFIPPMLENFQLSALLIGFIMTWDNILNMFLQPWVGSRSDRTRSRFGRRKPWLMLGAPIAALFFVLVPFVRDNFVLIALAILGTNIGMALFRSPTIAYLGDLFHPEQRSKANGVINLMGGVGGAIALFGGGALYRMGVPLPFLFGAAVLLLAIVVVLLAVKDPPLAGGRGRRGGAGPARKPAQRRTRRQPQRALPAVGHLLLVCRVELYGDLLHALCAERAGIEPGRAAQMLTLFAAMLIVFAIPSGLIATRVGRKPTILVGLAGMVAGLVAVFLLRNPAVLTVVLPLMGGFWALVNINSLPMVYDLGEQRSIGAYTGLYYLSSSAAAITGPLVAGGIIDLAGKNYAVLWVFAAVFMALAAVLMLQVQPKRVVQPLDRKALA